MKNARTILIVAAIAVIAGTIWYLESRKAPSGGGSGDYDIPVAAVSDGNSDREEIYKSKASRYQRAKEISTPDGFINTDPVTITGLLREKKVVLVDFWTYSCINCQRTLPYLNSWNKKYKDDGLVILGIHTPEFEFEKDYENVKRAVEKFGVEHPVVLDNDYSTWRAYKNRYWPRKYLIDMDGFIVYDHIGEGSYDETEREIVKALNERKRALGEPEIDIKEGGVEGVQQIDLGAVRTPEIYFGSARMRDLENLPRRSCIGSSCEYSLPQDISPDLYALGGTWNIQPEFATLESNSGTIRLRFSANKVNIVAGTETPVTAKVLLDGTPVSDSGRGSDVSGDTVTFGAHDLYNLIDLHGNPGEHMLEIQIEDPGFSAFTFTFG